MVQGNCSKRFVVWLARRIEVRCDHEGRSVTNPANASLDDALTEIMRITRISDASLRNLFITQAYCELSSAIATVTGTGNANWSSFATWASKTAGRSIRGEDVPAELVTVLREKAQLDRHLAELRKRTPSLLGLKVTLDASQVIRAIIAEVSDQVAAGNLKVFAELAPLFARFHHMFADPKQRTPRELEAFLAPLTAGSAARGGQDSLKRAFSSYLAAASVTSTKERAELILYGNLLIGLHEQTRLQPNIKAAIDAPFSTGVYRRLAAGTIWAIPGLHTLFTRKLELIFQGIHEPWERAVTRHMMRLALPHGSSVPLGEDLRVDGRPFPRDLDPLNHPPLVELVRTYDPNLDSLRGSGARNWTDLGNRMAFIADLFRSRQCDASIFEPPFSPPQLVLLRGGKMPGGPL